jgi:hypothetical protein
MAGFFVSATKVIEAWSAGTRGSTRDDDKPTLGGAARTAHESGMKSLIHPCVRLTLTLDAAHPAISRLVARTAFAG